MEETKEIIKRWEPLPNLPTVLNLVSVYDDLETLTILLEEKDPASQRLRVSFDSALFYQKGDEGDLLKSVYARHELVHQALNTAQHSDLLRWFFDQQYNDPHPRKVTHYIFWKPNDIFEVLALRPPVVEWTPVS